MSRFAPPPPPPAAPFSPTPPPPPRRSCRFPHNPWSPTPATSYGSPRDSPPSLYWALPTPPSQRPPFGSARVVLRSPATLSANRPDNSYNFGVTSILHWCPIFSCLIWLELDIWLIIWMYLWNDNFPTCMMVYSTAYLYLFSYSKLHPDYYICLTYCIYN